MTEQEQELQVVKTQVKDLLTMQQTSIHQMEVFTADQEEGEEEPIIGDAIDQSKPVGPSCPMKTKSVQDSVGSAMWKRRTEPTKSTKSEKESDQVRGSEGDQPKSSREGVVHKFHRMVHTVVGGDRNDLAQERRWCSLEMDAQQIFH